MQIIEETTCTWIKQGGITYIRFEGGTWFRMTEESMEPISIEALLERRYQIWYHAMERLEPEQR